MSKDRQVRRRVSITSIHSFRFILLAAFSIAVFFIVLQPRLRAAESASGALKSPSQSLVLLHLKFEGAGTCNSPKCHGAADATAAPARPGNEFTVWSGKDKHNAAFTALSSDRSKAIAKTLGIADAATSDRCLSCHALNAPAALRGDHFDISEGVTCNACHGPSEKWSQPHSKTGWLDAQRAAYPDHSKLLATWGIYNTRPIDARAERCTSCHLAIDAQMVKADHPQPVFDLAYYSENEPKHWRDPEGYFMTRLWAAGQAVCLRDALTQLADRAGGNADPAQVTDAFNQAMSHYSVFRQVLAAQGSSAALDGAMKGVTTAAASGVKSPAVAAQATAASQLLATLLAPTAAADFDKAKTLKILTAIANDDALTKSSAHGQEQQAFAVYELLNTYAAAENYTGPATDAVAKLPPDPGKPMDPDFAKNLADAQSEFAEVIQMHLRMDFPSEDALSWHRRLAGV